MASRRAERAPQSGARLPLLLLLVLGMLLGAAFVFVGLLAPGTPPGGAPISVNLALDHAPPSAEPAAHPAPPPPTGAEPAAQPAAEPAVTKPAATEPAAAKPIAARPALPQLDTRDFAALPPGKTPREAYARPFEPSESRPRIAVILTGLGLSSAATDTAITSLPGSITLAFMPYADDLNGWVRRARDSGHEVLLSLPMEPANFPAFDPGPQALLTSLTTKENLARLAWTLGRTSGYVGVVAFMGSHFTTSRRHLTPVLEAIKARGLLYVDNGAAFRSVVGKVARSIDLPVAADVRLIDEHASRAEIDANLRELERIAKQSGRSVGIGSLYPLTLERISAWAPTVERRGVVLAPVSAVAAMTLKASDG